MKKIKTADIVPAQSVQVETKEAPVTSKDQFLKKLKQYIESETEVTNEDNEQISEDVVIDPETGKVVVEEADDEEEFSILSPFTFEQPTSLVDENNTGIKQTAEVTFEQTNLESLQTLPKQPMEEAPSLVSENNAMPQSSINTEDLTVEIEELIAQLPEEKLADAEVRSLLEKVAPMLKNEIDDKQIDTKTRSDLPKMAVETKEGKTQSGDDFQTLENSIHVNRRIQPVTDQIIPDESNQAEIIPPTEPTEIEVGNELTTDPSTLEPVTIEQTETLATPIETQPTTQKAPTESLMKVPQEQWVSTVEQIVVEQVQGAEGEKVTTTHIQLTPEHLGKMDVELTLENKQLIIRFSVEQPETKQWLESQLITLTNSLATQEISLGQVQVDVNPSLPEDFTFVQQDQAFQEQKQSEHKQAKSKSYFNQNNEEPEILPRTESSVQGLSLWA